MNKYVEFIVWLLVVIGGINWGLVGAFDLNVVALVFGTVPILVTVVYVLIGLSAVVMVVQRFRKG